MAKIVDSDALGIVNRALGLTGAGAALTEFLDGQLAQTLDVAALIRRGRTLAGTSGMFQFVLTNVHTGATTLTTTLRPYNQATNVTAPFPAPVPRHFDLWYFGAQAIRLSGTGTVVGELVLGNIQLGIGENDSGVAVGAGGIIMATWDSLSGAISGSNALLLSGIGAPFQGMRIRHPRSATDLQWTTVSSATSSYRCQVIVGLFPAGLGQDLGF